MERRKRDSNPRAGYPTYTLSRGTSSASWVFLRIDIIFIQIYQLRRNALPILLNKNYFVNTFF